MPDSPTSPSPAAGRKESASPCRRCGGRGWDIEIRPKARIRWLMETVFAAPDVWIFQSESAGWPGRQYERWTCANCGRRVRV